METKARYVLIGAFTLAVSAALLGFFIWLGKFEADRQFAYYDIYFNDVSGLNEAGTVRFNGLPVGQVADLALALDGSGRVRVRVEIDAGVPVTSASIAELAYQGVTGVSYVAIVSEGNGDPLVPARGESYPIIPSRRSPIQSVLEGAPELLGKAVVLLEDLQKVVNEDNRQAVATILSNLESASGELDATLKDVRSLTKKLSDASTGVSEFLGSLDQTRLHVENITAGADRFFAEDLPGIVEDVKAAVAGARTTLDEAGAAMSAVSGRIDGISDSAMRTLDTATTTFERANNTLVLLDDALGQASATMKTANETFSSANALIAEDIRPVARSLEQAIAQVSADLPVISADLQSAAHSARVFIGNLEVIVSENTGPLSSFMKAGLPQFIRFVQEARILIQNLERLTSKIESDPARFLLGTQAPEVEIPR